MEESSLQRIFREEDERDKLAKELQPPKQLSAVKKGGKK